MPDKKPAANKDGGRKKAAGKDALKPPSAKKASTAKKSEKDKVIAEAVAEKSTPGSDVRTGGGQPSQVVIENPVINSPYEMPSRHFKFGEEGITNEVVDGRRSSSYFVPIAPSKKKRA